MTKEGYYFVHSKVTGEKTIAQFDDSSWWIVGCGDPFMESEFYHIGPKIEMPLETQAEQTGG